MRDPKRIKTVLEKIETIWNKIPDLRLMQLLVNALHDVEKGLSGDYFYLEDDVLLEFLERHERFLDENKNFNKKTF